MSGRTFRPQTDDAHGRSRTDQHQEIGPRCAQFVQCREAGALVWAPAPRVMRDGVPWKGEPKHVTTVRP